MHKKHLNNVSFEFIRYANCWEDADVLLQGLEVDENSKVMSIASAGDNCFSLLAANPKLVIAVDVSAVQLYVVELKKVAIQHLNHAEFLEFLGVRKSNNRGEVYTSLKSDLSNQCKNYWDNHIPLIENGLIHQGKFEKYFQLFKNEVLPTVHSRTIIDRLFIPKTVAEQTIFHDTEWHTAEWEKMYRQFFGVEMMGTVGRDPAFLKHVKGASVPDLILEREMDHLRNIDCQRNYFLYYILYNKFNEDFLPHYLRKENYELIQKNIDNLELHHGLLDAALENHPDCTHFNLSDIFEYMDPTLFAIVSDNLIQRSAKGAKFAYWNLLIDRSISKEHPIKVKLHIKKSKDLKKKDLGYFYGNFVLEEKI